MAIATIDTYLLDGGAASGSASYSDPLVAIKDFPDLEGEREEIDVTSLSDDARVFIEGVQNNTPWVFTCNYTKATYETLAALADTEKWYAVYIGDTSGTDGIFSASGYLSVKKSGGGVGDAQEMTVKIMLTSDVSET